VSNCRVFKRANPGAVLWPFVGADGSVVRLARRWVGVCEVCGDEVRSMASYGWQATRKNVRDALYHHMRTKHAGPGGAS